MNKLFVLILVSTVCYGQQDKVKGKLNKSSILSSNVSYLLK